MQSCSSYAPTATALMTASFAITACVFAANELLSSARVGGGARRGQAAWACWRRFATTGVSASRCSCVHVGREVQEVLL